MHPKNADKQYGVFKINLRTVIWILCIAIPSLALASPDVFFKRLLGSVQVLQNPTPLRCGETLRKQWVRETAEYWYLWNEELAEEDPDDFNSTQAYLDALTAPMAGDGRDPGYSYITTRERDETQFTSGAYIGFGFRWGIGSNDEFFLADVFEGGPAWLAGFRRGMQVIAIDTGTGFESWEALTFRDASSEEVFGPAVKGTRRGFRLSGADGEILEVIVEKDELDPPAIAGEPTLIPRSGLAPVAYLNLRQFTQSARQPLRQASLFFRKEGVTDFIVDLRYNGGGLLSVADLMLDLLGGRLAAGERSFYLAHNKQRSAYDSQNEAFFTPLRESVAPLRFAFITTGSTASASELVINSLAPHSEVVLIGSNTRGKAVGQYAFDQSGCEARLRLVSFEIANGEGIGGYYNGLASTGRFTLCAAQDDLSRAFTDLQETSIATALQWLSDGVCPENLASKRSRESRKNVLPDWVLELQVFDRTLDPMRY